MNIYKDSWLSLVKFAKGVAAQAYAQGLCPVLPVFVNFDAHAEFNTLPTQDFICISGYALHIDEKIVTLFASIGFGTYSDPENVRLIDLMGLLVQTLVPGNVIPLYANGNPTVPVTNMVVANSPIVEPTEKGNLRGVQLMSVRLLPGRLLVSS